MIARYIEKRLCFASKTLVPVSCIGNPTTFAMEIHKKNLHHIMIKLEYKSNLFQVIPGDIIFCSLKKQQIQILCDLVYSKNTEDLFYDMLPNFIEDACCFIEKYLLDRFRVKVRVVYCGNHTSTAYGDRINGYHLQSVEFESSLLV